MAISPIFSQILVYFKIFSITLDCTQTRDLKTGVVIYLTAPEVPKFNSVYIVTNIGIKVKGL